MKLPKILDPLDLAFKVGIIAMFILLAFYIFGLTMIFIGADWWIRMLADSPCG